MSNLRPCSSCARHVRNHVTACPFCDAPLTPLPSEPVAISDTTPRRASLVFGVAVGAVAVSTSLFGAGCLAYGGPSPRDAGTDAEGSSEDASSEPDAP